MLRDELFAMLNRDKLSDYLPYLVYEPDNRIYLNADHSIGFMLELSPVPFSGGMQVNALQTIYNLNWPKDTVLQTILYADPDQEEILQGYRKERDEKCNDDFLKEWSNRFCDYLWNHRHTGISQDIPVPFRNFRVFFCAKYKTKNFKDIENEVVRLRGLRESVQGAFKAAHIEAVDVRAEEMIYILHRIINPGCDYGRKVWNDTQPLSDQMVESYTKLEVESEYLKINDWYVKVKTPRVYCSKPTTYKINLLLGDLASGGNQLQIPCPYMIVLNVVPKDAGTHIHGRANFVAAQKAATKLAPRLMRKKEEYFRAVDEMEEGAKFLWGYITVILFAENEKIMRRADKILDACWAKQQFELQDEKWFNLPLFLYALPFGVYVEGINKIGRFESVDSKTLAMCSPIQADWRGTTSPVMLFISRRGQIVTLDIQESDTNYNCFVAAESGAGKSFLTNYMVTNYLSLDGEVYIIDIGRSYKKLCEILGGQYIEFTADSGISLNIFSTLTPEMFDGEEGEKLFVMLVSLLSQMVKPREKISDYERKVLGNALLESIKKAFEKGTYVTIDGIIETLKEQSEDLEGKQLQDRRKSDLAEMLEPFSSRGIVGKWFEGPLNLDFNKKFVVLELEELNSNPELREVVLLMIMSLIDIKLYFGDKSRPKLIIIDEAWQLLRGENTANFIETGYRRARKYKGSFVTITQSVMDFFREDNAGVGQAIISNSAYKFLLVQKKEDLFRAKKEGKLVLSDFEMKLAETIHTIPGEYSEIFIKTERSYGIGRLFVDKFTQYLYSTKPAVVQYIEDKMKEGMTLVEAIDMAIKENIN